MNATDNKEFDLMVSNYGTTRDIDYDIAILPWGATEPHNLHLPYLTDALLSHDIAVDAARLAWERHGVRAMVLPPVSFGQQNPGQHGLKFCMHGRYETQKAILTDVAASLRRQGLKRLLILNGHGGNSFRSMIRDLAIEMPDMLIAEAVWYKVADPKEYFDQPGDHADELETSVMMHYHPELVRLEDAGSGLGGGFSVPSLAQGHAWMPRDWSRVSHDTGIGSPAAATADKGRRFAQAVVSVHADTLRDLVQPNLYRDF